MLFWNVTREIYSKWDGVPPVPSRAGAIAMSLGDNEFSYRLLAIMLQNFGDVGRDITPLKDYNYQKLGQWFHLLHSLDPVSDHIPLLAANYFGGTLVPKDVAYVVDYLKVAGNMRIGEKWRWLAQAAYLAQHRLNDLDMALGFAYQLQNMNREGVAMPQWARQMPVFVLKYRGEKEASRHLMENLLVTDKTMEPNEVNFMRLYLTEDLGVDQKEVEGLLRLRGIGAAAK